jgi:hypothetical protein
MSKMPFLEVYENELIRQGREKLDSGGWSEQDPENYNGNWPMGELKPGWSPCEYDGEKCIPYQDDMLVMEKMTNLKTNELTVYGEWSPWKYVANVVAGGFSMAVNCPEPGSMVLYGMCSKCGMVVTRAAEADDDNLDAIRWCPTYGWGWVPFPG